MNCVQMYKKIQNIKKDIVVYNEFTLGLLTLVKSHFCNMPGFLSYKISTILHYFTRKFYKKSIAVWLLVVMVIFIEDKKYIPNKKIQPTDINYQKILEEVIEQEIPKKYHNNTTPRAFIIGGQPGSGKTTVLTMLSKRYRKLLVINGDDYRIYHPNYLMFLQDSEETASEMTQSLVNYMVEGIINYCILHSISFIVEGTMKTPAASSATISRLQNTSFRIYVCPLACSYGISLESTKTRYRNQKELIGCGRITPQTSHDTAFYGIPSTLEYLSNMKEVYKFLLFKREDRGVKQVNEYQTFGNVVQDFNSLRI